MALDIEVVVDGGMGGKEPLGRARRSKSPPLPLSAARRLVRDFRTVVRPAAGYMAISQASSRKAAP